MVSFELGKEWRKMFFVLSGAWNKEKLSPQKGLNFRPSDSALRCSTIYGERGLLRSSYDTRPAYC